jgi:hypothetical protein
MSVDERRENRRNAIVPGQIKRVIDRILEQRGNGNPTLVMTTKTKLILKGLNPDRFTAESPDDPGTLAKAQAIAADLGVKL